MTDTQIGQLFRQGQLAPAIAAATQAARENPSDAGARVLLAELLLFAGQFERADALLDAANAVDPGPVLVIAEFRQLLRAAIARRQLAREGRVPEFIGGPTPSQTHLLQAFVALRANDHAAATKAAEAAEAARPAVAGTGNGMAFTDFRDADDLLGGTLEMLTTTGKYFWIPVERVVNLEFHPPKRPRDLFWRRCTTIVRDGPEGDVYMPATYEPDDDAGDGPRLGRSTDWTAEAPIRGQGQRVFLVGDAGIPIHELGCVEFA